MNKAKAIALESNANGQRFAIASTEVKNLARNYRKISRTSLFAIREYRIKVVK